MTVLLRTSRELPPTNTYDVWLALTGTETPLDPARRLADPGQQLEQAFDAIRDDWWRIGHSLGQTPGGELAHTPTGAAFISDFGQNLAWSKLVKDFTGEKQNTLVICDDPWLFRHLAALPGVDAGAAPVLWVSHLKLWVRGYLSRLKVAGRMLLAALSSGRQRRHAVRGTPTLLVYGHPTSTGDGYDAYFGTMMKDIPGLARAVHTDCPPARAGALATDGRTFSLHAWGNPFYALALPFTRWRPPSTDWLVRRAAAIENGGGAQAMTRWQIHCQNNWLHDVHPISVSWSWENHPWERAFVRAARKLNVHSIGSQDTDVGPHQLNMSPATNIDGLDSIADVIICNGPAYRDELLAWGIPFERLVIGGSYRIARFEADHFDPQGPVYVALSSDPEISDEMMQAVENAKNGKRRFLVKDHPMYPYPFEETDDIHRTTQTIPENPGISAVLYGTGLSGLEGLLAGVPTFRLLPSNRLGIDTLPALCSTPTVSIDSFGETLDENPKPPTIAWDNLFCPVDIETWRHHLFYESKPR